MGVGSLSMIVPMYNAECAPPEIRGAMVGMQQMAITTGIMIAFWIDYGTNYIGGSGDGQSDAAWLVPLCLQLFPAFILGIGMIFMVSLPVRSETLGAHLLFRQPFSPRWLVHHDREADARKTLASLRNLSPDHDLIELEFLEIKAQSMFEKRTTAEHFPHLADGSAWSTVKLQFVAAGSLFKSKAMFRRVMLATVTMFFQQWTVSFSTSSRFPVSTEHANSDTCMIGHQRCPVLRPSDLQRLRSLRNHHVPTGKWCCRHCHVVCYHPCRSLRRQGW
jgi:MFS family permease